MEHSLSGMTTGYVPLQPPGHQPVVIQPPRMV